MIPEFLQQDRGVAIAYMAAVCAASGIGESYRPELWPQLFGHPDDQSSEAVDYGFAVCLETYAPLVRKSGDVPPEALYRHGREMRAHAGPAEGWQQQPQALRLAFTIFAKALVIADQAIAAEAAELALAANAEAGTDPARRAAGAGRRSAVRKVKGPLQKAVLAPKGAAPTPRGGAPAKGGKKKGK